LSLQNLKSIFEDELNQKTDDFKSKSINDVNDTKFFDEPPRPTIYLATNPTDFSTAIGNNELPFTPLNQMGDSFLDGLSWEKLYNPNHSYKSDAGHKGLTPISYSNINRDKLNIRNPDDGRFGFGGSFRTSAISAVGKLIGEVPFFNGNVTEFLKDTGKEPYIVSTIPKNNSDLFSGRTINFGGRDFPIARSLTDTVRLAKFLTSPAGLLFIEKQKVLVGDFPSPLNNLGLKDFQGQKYKKGYNPISTLISTFGRAGGGPLVPPIDRTQPTLTGLLSFLNVGEEADSYPDFNPLEEPIETLVFSGGSPMGRRVLDDSGGVSGIAPNFENFIKPKFGLYRDKFENPNESFGETSIDTTNRPLARLNDSFTGNGTTVEGKTYPKDAGDKHTLLSFGSRDREKSNELNRIQYKDKIEEAHSQSDGDGIIDGDGNGMPFYFKDMRDGAFIFFRAYLEGLSENVSPQWSSQTYMGRSEPVWVYERAEREINFTLKLFAQSKKELSAIYEKMNRLTSLCYPEYFIDNDNVNYGNRMKPPLTKLRLGDMYGSKNNELMGYIKSLSYSVDQSSPYETEINKKVPKHIITTIGYQVIHGQLPQLKKSDGTNYEFYGYTGNNEMADPQNISTRLGSGEDV